MNQSCSLKNLVIVFILIISPGIIFAQESWDTFEVKQPPKFRSIADKDGLSQNWVRCIYQDDFGFMWFGTSGGLNRYDGYKVKTYSLGNVNVNSITKKSENELWICNDLGVFIYDQNNDSISSFSYLKGHTVLCSLQDKDSIVWFGTNTGLFRYNALSDDLVSYKSGDNENSGLSDNYINKLFLDSDNNVWVGTKVGLNRYVRNEDFFVSYRPSSNPNDISGNDIMAICEDSENRIWVGTAKNGVNVMLADGENVRFKKVVNGAILSLLIDEKNKLWIGTGSNGGVLQIDLNSYSVDQTPEITKIKRNSVDPYSLSDNSGFCIYKDNLNDIWIGTYGGGVNYYSYGNKDFFSIKKEVNVQPSLSSDLVNAIWEEERFLWLATEGGLDQFDKLNKTTKHFYYDEHDPTSLSSDFVYSLFKDSRGNLWVGTWTGGLNRYDYNTRSFKRFVPDGEQGSISNENVFSIFEDSKNNLWVATVGGGLNKYDYKTNKFESYIHDPKNPKSIYFDIVLDVNETQDGKLLVASQGSLDIFDSSNKEFTHYPLNDIDSSNIRSRYIIDIYVDSKDNIWLGSNEGLLLFDKEKEFKVFTPADGLAGYMALGIVEDDNGNLWVSTDNGLSKFVNAVETLDSAVFINFNERDGLTGNVFKGRAAFKNESGLIYFGTSKGLSYFYPESINLNQISPDVVFVEMELLQFQPDNGDEEKCFVKNVNTIDKIELPFNKSDFTISFAALNYLNPEDNKYKYMLEGYDPDWVVAGTNRVATYKNLHPNKYTFKVLGSNNDGVWSNSPKTLQIIITPPFWQTWLFQYSVILLLIGLVYLLFSWRLKAIQREKRKLEKLVSERTSELSELNSILEEQSEELTNQNEVLSKSQEQLSLYKDHLEELVVKRTNELENAKNKAEESDRLKSSFLANMSHEIRTPLNAIIGFTDLFNESDTDDDTRKSYQHIIKANVDNLLRLIEDILDLSTIEANQIVIEYSSFSPVNIFHEVYQQFLVQVKTGVEFKMEIDERSELTAINSDEYRFRQIISNLVSNAIKFTESGSIEMGYYSDDVAKMIFYVKDSGIGISEEEQEIIFDHFTKVENTTKMFRGVGLGLAISKQLVELLNGEIWIESEPGKGSIFYFTQPLSK